MLALDTKSLRVAGVSSLALAAVVPLLPGHDAIACPLRAATGIPCPFCGMTRGVNRALHADVGGAFALNPGSLVLVFGVLALIVTARRTTFRVPAWAPAVLLAALWAFQLVKYATGRPL
ncbi:MAG: DUF2752 domain-containing protein [Acidimicrobiia bacterium]